MNFDEASPEQLRAAIMLAAEDEVFFSQYQGRLDSNPEYDATNPRPVLNCSDIFYPAADGEVLTWDETPMMWQLVRDGGWPAAVKWIAEKRGIKPMVEVQVRMDTYTREGL